jgi:hypothetical protein
VTSSNPELAPLALEIASGLIWVNLQFFSIHRDSSFKLKGWVPL